MRNIKNLFFKLFCSCCLVFSLVILCSVLYPLFKNGLPALGISLFSQNTPPPEVSYGGLKNAILGSVLMTALALFIATPMAVFSATYLANSAKAKKIASLIRFANDILLSAPSIVVGLFAYVILVRSFHSFSALAGSVALAIIAFPIMTRTMEDIFHLLPSKLKEAAAALALPKWKIAVHVLWKASQQGMITSVLLATARIAGETAPLLFTALNNQFLSFNMYKPMANLPVTIYQFSMSPYDNWQALAWGAALLITLFVLCLNGVIRLQKRARKKAYDRR